MIAFCKGNATQIYPKAIEIGTNFYALEITDGVKSIQAFTKVTYGSIFNCFYTVTNPVQAAQYNKNFTYATILWNILFNLGYMYTNGKSILTFFYYNQDANGDGTLQPTETDNRSWEDLGKYIGDFAVRFIYSKYVAKTYYKF